MAGKSKKLTVLPGQALLFDRHVLLGAVGPEALAKVRESMTDCHRCNARPADPEADEDDPRSQHRPALWETRKHIVVGAGACPLPPIAFVGEAPGANEDRTGVPFCGNAGELLNRMLQAIGYSRDQVFVTNAVACRPPGNRAPDIDEVATCRPHLIAQLRAVRPRLIVALGASGARALLGSREALTALRGSWFEWEDGTPIRVTYHPARLLREPLLKREAWADLQVIQQRLKAIMDGDSANALPVP